jgi:O-antigen ligase
MSLPAWNVTLDQLPASDPRNLGRWLLWLGCAAMLVGAFLTPPWGKIGIAVAFTGVLLARAPIHRLAATWVGALLGLWVLLSVGTALARHQPGVAGLAHLPGLSYDWLAIPCAAAAACDARWRRITLMAAIAIGTLSLAVGLLQFGVGLGTGPLRIDPDGVRFQLSRGFTAYHLSFGFAGALLAALCVPVAACGLGRAWLWTGRVVAVAVLAICGARAALVGGVATISTALALRGRRWLLAAVVVGAVLGGLLVARMALMDADRLREMLAGQNGRWPIWTVAVAMVAEHPLVGVGGRDAFKQAWNPLYERVAPGPDNEFGPRGGAPHAHNWQLSVAAEHGIPAALLHLALLGAVLVVLWRRRAIAPTAWQSGGGLAVAVLVIGLFEPAPTLAAPGMGLNACLGLVLGLALCGEPTQPTVPQPSMLPPS